MRQTLFGQTLNESVKKKKRERERGECKVIIWRIVTNLIADGQEKQKFWIMKRRPREGGQRKREKEGKGKIKMKKLEKRFAGWFVII